MAAMLPLIAAAAPAFAQADVVATSLGGGQYPRLDFNLSFKSSYDTNVARTSAEAADARGIEEKDFRFTPALNVDIYRPLGTGYASLAGLVGYDFFASNTVLNRERIELNGGAGQRLGPCAINATSDYGRRQSDFANLTLQELASEYDIETQNVETRFNVGGLLACGGTVGLMPFGVISYGTARNSSILRLGQDADLLTYGGGLLYTHPAVGEIRLFGTQSDIDFIKRDGVIYLGAPKISTRSAGIRIARELGARLSGHVMFMYTDVDQGSSVKSFSGTTWEGQLALRATDRLRLEAAASRSIDPSLGFNVDYIKMENYSLKAIYSLGARSSFTLGGEHRIRDLVYSLVTNPDTLNHDSTNRVLGSFRFDANRRLGLVFDVGYEKRDADADYYDYDSFQAAMTILVRL